MQAFEDELRDLGLKSEAIGNVPGYDPTFERRDGHLLFENRLSAFFTQDKTRAQTAKRALQSLLRDLNDGHRPLEPAPYYAVLLADGDKMGVSISKATTIAKNQNLSRALSRFAVKAKDCVTNARGSLIYAGGDDVLALLPLHSALECARELHDEFGAVFRDSEFQLDWLAPDFPTLSVGLAVVHHLEPLSEALALARTAEKRAKSVQTQDPVAPRSKDALAVLVNKRSGGELLVADHWQVGEAAGLDTRLKVFVEWAKGGEVAAGLAYEWRDLTLRVRLQTPPANDPQNAEVAKHNAVVSQIHLSEAKRLAKRKRERGGERDVGERVLTELCQVLDLTQLKAKPNQPWLAHLADELIAAREFAAAITLAHPAPTSSAPVPTVLSTTL